MCSSLTLSVIHFKRQLIQNFNPPAYSFVDKNAFVTSKAFQKALYKNDGGIVCSDRQTRIARTKANAK